ncbi:MAG: putative transposase [Zhongshania sp.]|jgi:putative transposase
MAERGRPGISSENKITTKRKHSDDVAANLLNQNLNPVGQDQIWAGDITYLKTAEGWV